MLRKNILAGLRDPSLWLLLITNVTVIFYVLESGIDLVNLIYIYLGQNIIIGFFTFLKLFKIGKYDDSLKSFLPIAFPFVFLVHYGIFNGIYTIVLIQFSVGTLDTDYIWTGILILFFNHLFSFIYNWNNLKHRSVMIESARPYPRIIPMHLIMFIVPTLQANIVIIFFLALKIAVDMFSHYIKYKPRTSHLTTQPTHTHYVHGRQNTTSDTAPHSDIQDLVNRIKQ